MKRLILTAALIVAGTTMSQAYSSSSRIDERQARQSSRIEKGLHDGSLTRREARALTAEQYRIQSLERRAKRDGVISYHERMQIQRAQRAASRHIRSERHDAQGRRTWW